MMNWSDVGSFLKGNAKGVTGLVGSLLTGNVVGAVSAGASMVAQATGTTDPNQALMELQDNADAMIKLKSIALDRQQEINRHIENIMQLELEDKQRSHTETQTTIRNGDNAEGGIKWVRPLHATLSLLTGIAYVFITDTPELAILGAFLTLPSAYAGLRAYDKRNAIALLGKK